MINIDISVGDQILVGRFKNKRIEVKTIGVDKHGGPTINGRSILKIRKAKSPTERREAVHYILDAMERDSLGEAPMRERTDRFNNVHAETKKELKAAMSKALDQIVKGKNPKFDIINGRTGEMIGWIESQEYHWQPTAIASALRELK